MLKKIDEKQYSIATRLIYGKSPASEWNYDHHVIPPMTASSTYRLDSATRGAQGFSAFSQIPGPGQSPIYIYDRFGQPTVDMLQHALATAEEKECAITFATGMAAVHAALCFALNQGSEIISHKTVYGCTYSLLTNWLSRLGIKTHFVDLTDPKSFTSLVNENTRVLYLESPVNPNLELIDTEAVMAEVNKINEKRSEDKKILTVFDNTFATPFCQRPGKHGVDIIVHSLTKGISGFGTDMGGAVVTAEKYREQLIVFRKDFGGILSSSAAWHILIYGISTLPLRVPKQQSNAQKIAEFLEQHPLVEKVNYPGLPSFNQYKLAQRLLRNYDDEFAPGFMIYFNLKSESPEQSKFLGEQMMNHIADNAYTVTLAVSLGQLRTLIEHPGSMTHVSFPAAEQMRRGIDPGGIRLAVGIEKADDVIKDLKAALEHIKKSK